MQVKGHVDDAVAQGARLVMGGSDRPDLGGPYDKGYFFQPTVIADATPSMKIYREETFGPAMPMFKFRYDEEAVKLANDTEYGLAAYFFTKVSTVVGITAADSISDGLCVLSPALAAAQHVSLVGQL